MTEEVEAQEEEQPQEEMLAKALAGFVGAPTEAEIVAWKQKHGDIFCSGFSETELFVWRPISRQEFGALQVELASLQQQVSPLEMEERTVRKCLLWSSESGEMACKNKAGSLSTLHEQVMQQSNFMDPRVAAQLVIKL